MAVRRQDTARRYTALRRRLEEGQKYMAEAKQKNWAVGRWLIESMDQWDRDFIDEEVRGYFELDAKCLGDFQFGYVRGQIDYRCCESDGKPTVEFSWDGYDAGGGNECSGRGCFVLEGEELRGEFFFHQGDESGIVLKRESEKKAKKRK
jgi:hypothetical protein